MASSLSLIHILPARPTIDVLGDCKLINIRQTPFDNILNAFIKRAMDVVGSLVPVSYTHLDVDKRQVVTRVRPDYRVGYGGSSNLPTDTVTALENTLAAYCDDRNGDGKVVVELSLIHICPSAFFD